MKHIDLNADLGESAASLHDGTQEALLSLITSANIACGGHAGDASIISATVAQCRQYGVAIGAHPSYPDRANFGRAVLDISSIDLVKSIAAQVQALLCLAPEITHVKAHGALYNRAAKDPVIAQSIVDASPPDVILYGLRNSLMLPVFAAAGFRIAREVFADRAYQPDGSLRPRHLPGALITDPPLAAANALLLAEDADTICIHSDTPNAIEIARAVRHALEQYGFTLRPV